MGAGSEAGSARETAPGSETLPAAQGLPILHLVLVQPEIAPNTGNVARLAAAIGARLHLVGRLGFHLEERRVRRAGLDYWPHVDLRRHVSWDSFKLEARPTRLIAIEADGATSYSDFAFQTGDALVFGSESAGLSTSLQADCLATLRLPMPTGKVRSLNLANTVAIVAYEALRQSGVR